MKKINSNLVIGLFILISLILIYLPLKGFINSHLPEIGVNAIGAYVGFLGAIVIYLFQVRDTIETAKRDTHNRHKEHLRYFAGVLDDVVIYAKKQSESLDEVCESIRLQPSIVHQLAFVASDSVGRLNRADNEAVYHVYNELFVADNMREQNYRAIWAQTDLLVANLGDVKQKFNRYVEAVYNRQLKLKELIQHIADETAFLLKDVRQNGPAAAFSKYAPNSLSELNDILVRYVELNAHVVPFETYFKDFIDPLKIWLHDNDNFLPINGAVKDRATNLVRLTKGASFNLTDLRSNSIDFLQAFDSQRIIIPSSNLEAFLNNLNEVAKRDD
jgi:hypothetical protein